VPLVLNHAEREDQDQEIDGVEAGEASQPELALDEGPGTIGVVVGENVAGDEEEDADEDVAVINDGIKEPEVRWCEVKEDDEDGKESANAGKGWELRLAGRGHLRRR